MDISETDILSRGNKFSLQEGNHTHDFEWLEFERLEKEYFYPLFLKKEIFICRRSLQFVQNVSRSFGVRIYCLIS